MIKFLATLRVLFIAETSSIVIIQDLAERTVCDRQCKVRRRSLDRDEEFSSDHHHGGDE
jgi:hypothetical protein